MLSNLMGQNSSPQNTQTPLYPNEAYPQNQNSAQSNLPLLLSLLANNDKSAMLSAMSQNSDLSALASLLGSLNKKKKEPETDSSQNSGKVESDRIFD